MQLKEEGKVEFNGIYEMFKEALDQEPFVVIIGKYDHILGPRALYSSFPIKDENFVRNLLRDALNTKNKFVILDFNLFYSQIYKVEIPDENARGNKQLYAIILLRDVSYPLIPLLHFKRIEMNFHKIGHQFILSDDIEFFEDFYNKINEMYTKKGEVLPLESKNMEIRIGVNTIQGFCELILEQLKRGDMIKKEDIENYIGLMLESCNEIIESLEAPVKSAYK